MLLDGVDEFLHGLFDEIEFSHLAAFIFFNALLDGEETGLIQLLWLNKHLNPLLLLPLKILHNRLMIDQVLLILREVLSTDVFDGTQLGIVLVIDVVVALVHLLGRVLYVFSQGVYVGGHLLFKSFLEVFDGLLEVKFALIMASTVIFLVFNLSLLDFLNSIHQVFSGFLKVVICSLIGLGDGSFELLAIVGKTLLLASMSLVELGIILKSLSDLVKNNIMTVKLLLIFAIVFLELKMEDIVLLVKLLSVLIDLLIQTITFLSQLFALIPQV